MYMYGRDGHIHYACAYEAYELTFYRHWYTNKVYTSRCICAGMYCIRVAYTYICYAYAALQRHCDAYSVQLCMSCKYAQIGYTEPQNASPLLKLQRLKALVLQLAHIYLLYRHKTRYFSYYIWEPFNEDESLLSPTFRFSPSCK